MVGLLYLAANDTLTLAFKSDGTGTLDIQHFTVTIRRVGEHEYLGVEQFDAIQFNTAAGIVDPTLGLMYWNADDHTLNLNVNAGPVLQIGQEFMMYASNKSGVEIFDGAVVYLSGAIADRATVILGDASDPIHARSTIGVATETIADNTAGFITTQGLVRGLDTLTPGWVAGDSLFLSDTVPGGLTTAPPPTPPAGAVFIGMVVRVHLTEGSIYVNIADAGRVVDHSDVLVSGIADGEGIFWNAAESRFENMAPPAGAAANPWLVDSYFDDDPDHSANAGSIHFLSMVDKTQSQLITDGWELDTISGSPATFDNVQNRGMQIINPAGAINVVRYPLSLLQSAGFSMAVLVSISPTGDTDETGNVWPMCLIDTITWDEIEGFYIPDIPGVAPYVSRVIGRRTQTYSTWSGGSDTGIYQIGHNANGDFLTRMSREAGNNALWYMQPGHRPSMKHTSFGGWIKGSVSIGADFNYFGFAADGAAQFNVRWMRRLG